MPIKTLRSFVPMLGIAAGAVLAAAPVHADTRYPSGPVTVVVPFGPGGSADLYTREVTEKLRQKFGQPFVIENRVGAGGVVGTSFAARAKPDGQTLLTTGNAQLISESLVKNKPYELLRDFVPVAPINEADLVLVVNSEVKARSIEELVALAKASPGKLNYSSAGTGTPYHLAGELFKSMAGVDVMHVPYKSSGEARTAVLAGEVAYMFDSVATMIPHLKTGKVRALATTGSERSLILPDVKTMNESGLSGYRATVFVGLMAPKGTPPEVARKLNAAINEITGSPEVKNAWARQGVSAMPMDTEKFREYLKGEIDKYSKIVKDADVPSM